MEANELMIGDLVLCNGMPYRIMHCGHLGEILDYPDKFKPIQITVEILERNGFKVKNKKHCHLGLGGRQKVSMFLNEDGWYIECLLLNRTFWSNNFKYVHELQHAFKLCGIKKDIFI